MSKKFGLHELYLLLLLLKLLGYLSKRKISGTPIKFRLRENLNRKYSVLKLMNCILNVFALSTNPLAQANDAHLDVSGWMLHHTEETLKCARCKVQGACLHLKWSCTLTTYLLELCSAPIQKNTDIQKIPTQKWACTDTLSACAMQITASEHNASLSSVNFSNAG